MSAYHSAPAIGAVDVTSSNTTNLSPASRALWVGGAGTVSLLFENGSEATVEGVGDGTLLPFRVRRVNETGTSATSILALY